MFIFSDSPASNSVYQPSNSSIKWSEQEKWYQARLKAALQKKKARVVATVDLTLNDSNVDGHVDSNDDDDDEMGFPNAHSTATHHDI